MQKPLLFLLLGLLFILQVVRAQQEAKLLELKFGDTYREYRAQMWF
jgi:protein-S-isoprenylcysteine O-methyltransferase Ste14